MHARPASCVCSICAPATCTAASSASSRSVRPIGTCARNVPERLPCASRAGCRRRLTRRCADARGSARRSSVARGRFFVPADAWRRSSPHRRPLGGRRVPLVVDLSRSPHRSSGGRARDLCSGCTTGCPAAAGRNDGRHEPGPISIIANSRFTGESATALYPGARTRVLYAPVRADGSGAIARGCARRLASTLQTPVILPGQPIRDVERASGADRRCRADCRTVAALDCRHAAARR